MTDYEYDPYCTWCDGDYVEAEDYAGYTHAHDCGVLVFAEALLATADAADAR